MTSRRHPLSIECHIYPTLPHPIAFTHIAVASMDAGMAGMTDPGMIALATQVGGHGGVMSDAGGSIIMKVSCDSSYQSTALTDF